MAGGHLGEDRSFRSICEGQPPLDYPSGLDQVGEEGSDMEHIARAVKAHRAYFDSGETLDVRFRRNNLRRLQDTLFRYEERIYDAFWTDLHKSKF